MMHSRFTYISTCILALISTACATHRDIPAPTIPVPGKRLISVADGLTAPRQKAWQWDEGRYFTGELDHRCYGPIRFVDESKEIDTYVGVEEVPNIAIGSDDRDVVIAMIGGYRDQLIFSVDGGRTFLREVRGFPQGQTTHFVFVRNGHVYVGMQPHERNPDGYFTWRRPAYRSHRQESIPPMQESQLVILEAPLDKARGRIGVYRILTPRDYQFRSEYAYAAQDWVKRVDNLEAFGLPHSTGLAPSDACDRSLKLAPWGADNSREGLLKFYAWYDEMKALHPGWADADTDAFMTWHKKWYKGALEWSRK